MKVHYIFDDAYVNLYYHKIRSFYLKIRTFFTFKAQNNRIHMHRSITALEH